MKRIFAILLIACLSAVANGQSIAPGKYKRDELTRVHRAAFDIDGSGLLVTENRGETIALIMEYRWVVVNGSLIQSRIRFTKDRLNWLVTDDTSVPIRNINPTSFELQAEQGWVKWIREP